MEQYKAAAFSLCLRTPDARPMSLFHVTGSPNQTDSTARKKLVVSTHTPMNACMPAQALATHLQLLFCCFTWCMLSLL